MKTVLRQSELKSWKEEGTEEAIKRFSRLSPVQKIKKTQEWLRQARRLSNFKKV